MSNPRQTSVRFLAALGVACLAAAFPLKHSAQTDAERRSASPNGKIVFQSTQGGDGFVNDVYVMDADGKRQTRLTDDAGDDVSAVWSPQGDRIAFLSDRRGVGYELYVMSADGGGQRPLRAAAPVCPASFVWSPDGTRLAYAEGGDVFVIEADGDSAPVNVSVGKPAGTTDGSPSWSPNGGQLVVRNSTACGGCSDLAVVNAADGGGRVALSTGPGFDADPRWSPQGDLIAYEGDRGGRGVYVTRADGAGVETLVSGAVGSLGPAEWSPDGSRLAFRSLTDSAVYVVKADGAGLVAVSGATSGGGAILWAPDGLKVAYHESGDNGSVDILVVDADGSSRKPANYTKTRRADEFTSSWQRLPMP